MASAVYFLAHGAVKILNAQSLSNAMDTGGRVVRMIYMPATWTAASITFQSSHDGVTFQDVYDADGIELAVTTAASRAISLPEDPFGGARFIKLRSGTSLTPVAQAADRDLTLALRE